MRRNIRNKNKLSCPHGYVMINGVCSEVNKPGSAVTPGDGFGGHDLDYGELAVCHDYMSAHANCVGSSGLSNYCWQGNSSCCSCTTTGYGQWTSNTGLPTGPIMTEEEAESGDFFTDVWLPQQNFNFTPICVCHTTCQMPWFCQGGGPGGGGQGICGGGGAPCSVIM